MQAIRTRYHGPTNTRGSRISAQAEAGRIYLGYDDSKNPSDNHKSACEALRAKLGWVAPYYQPMYAGVFDGDTYWVFLSDRPEEVAP